jgi:hypothetical protein
MRRDSAARHGNLSSIFGWPLPPIGGRSRRHVALLDLPQMSERRGRHLPAPQERASPSGVTCGEADAREGGGVRQRRSGNRVSSRKVGPE